MGKVSKFEKELDKIRRKHQKERKGMTDSEVTALINNKGHEIAKKYGFEHLLFETVEEHQLSKTEGLINDANPLIGLSSIKKDTSDDNKK